MELPDEIEWPASVRELIHFDRSLGDCEANCGELWRPALSELIDMVRRLYWQRDQLLRLSTAYPAVMKEKLDADWDKRRAET